MRFWPGKNIPASVIALYMAIATLAEQRNIPFVIDVAALDAITAKGYKNVFRCFAKTEFFMSSMARYLDLIIKEKKVTRYQIEQWNTDTGQYLGNIILKSQC